MSFMMRVKTFHQTQGSASIWQACGSVVLAVLLMCPGCDNSTTVPTEPIELRALETSRDDLDVAKENMTKKESVAKSALEVDVRSLQGFKLPKSLSASENPSYEDFLRGEENKELKYLIERIATLRLEVATYAKKLEDINEAHRDIEQQIWRIKQRQRMSEVLTNEELAQVEAKIKAADQSRKAHESIPLKQDIAVEQERVFREFIKQNQKKISDNERRDPGAEATDRPNEEPEPKEPFEDAEQALKAHIAAYNARDKSRYWDAFATALDCFYDGANAQKSSLYDVRDRQFEMGGRTQKIESYIRHKVRGNRVAFKLRGALFHPPEAPINFYKLIVLEVKQNSWKIVIETDEAHMKCASDWWE